MLRMSSVQHRTYLSPERRGFAKHACAARTVGGVVAVRWAAQATMATSRRSYSHTAEEKHGSYLGRRPNVSCVPIDAVRPHAQTR